MPIGQYDVTRERNDRRGQCAAVTEAGERAGRQRPDTPTVVGGCRRYLLRPVRQVPVHLTDQAVVAERFTHRHGREARRCRGRLVQQRLPQPRQISVPRIEVKAGVGRQHPPGRRVTVGGHRAHFPLGTVGLLHNDKATGAAFHAHRMRIHLRLVQCPHPAPAAVAVRRVDDLPDGVVIAKYPAVENGMRRSGAVVHDRAILPVRAVINVAHLLLVAPGRVGRLQVGAKNRVQPVWHQFFAFQLAMLVSLEAAPQPALALQHRQQCILKLPQRSTAGHRCRQRLVNVVEHVQLHDAGNGKLAGVGLISHVQPVKRGG
ncbi:hypothetical protein D3C71_1375900 [compost metagenome]